MRPHSFQRHSSAAAIIREAYPEGAPGKLKRIRRSGMWGYVDIPTDPDGKAIIHFWFKDGTPLARVAALIGHELGHISGEGPVGSPGDQAEEDRADSYAGVAIETTMLLLKLGLFDAAR